MNHQMGPIVKHLCNVTKHELQQRTLKLFRLDSAALIIVWNEQQFYLFGWIQKSQTGDLLYSDTSPYGEYSPAAA